MNGEDILNFLIFVFFIAFAIFRAKQKAKRLQGNQTKPVADGSTEKQQPVFQVPPGLQSAAAMYAARPFNNKNLDKIVAVYGPGAMLSTEEVSILLNVSPETAQNYLDQLLNTGRATQTTSISGKVRYRLN